MAVALLAPLPLLLPVISSAAFAEPDSGLGVQAVNQALTGDFITGGELAQQSGDDAAVKLVELLYLKDKGAKAGYSRLMKFIEIAPKWPLSETFLKHAETALFNERTPAPVVLGHFSDRKPLTAEGQFALARALIETGDAKEGRKVLQQAWLRVDFELPVENQVMKEFGGTLSGNDHKARVWRLIMDQSPNAAQRNAKRIGLDYVHAAEAAKYLINGAAGAEKKLGSLPVALRDAPAMKYVLARYFRRLEKFGKARVVLASIPAEATAQVDAEAMWTERRIIARRSVGPKLREHWNTAYKIASNHGLSKGTSAVEAEFLAGWIALRYKKDTGLALKHFNALMNLAPTRTEKARASYWIGRTHLAAKDMTLARAAFKAASAHSTVYYGQLAREHVGLGRTPENIASGTVSDAAVARVSKDEVVRAFRLMQRTGRKDQLNLFLWSMSSRFDTAADMNAVASIVDDAGGLNMALRFAKAAGQRGHDIDAWAYPLRGLPNWKSVGKPVEKSLVFALSRQESEFNAKAGSTAGAQGLMQLMPGTARLVAKQYGMPFAVAKLTEDPAYNVRLGSAHLADLVAEYRGSYILTLVAYNAGPRRVSEWIAAYGDPRSANVDPIDWVESIPFHETRQYVQKVLQNVHIYRSRFAPGSVRPMSADLARGGVDGVTVASTTLPEAESCGGTSIAALVTKCD